MKVTTGLLFFSSANQALKALKSIQVLFYQIIFEVLQMKIASINCKK
jgi:hypothetical protein